MAIDDNFAIKFEKQSNDPVFNNIYVSDFNDFSEIFFINVITMGPTICDYITLLRTKTDYSYLVNFCK